MFLQNIKNPEDFKKENVKLDINDVVIYTGDLFEYALKIGASDIHIEPTKEFVSIRFRVHGDFWFIDKISHEIYIKLLSRIKIMAGIRIDEKLKPQDGKITYTSDSIENEQVDIRVSALPIIDGEKIV